MLAAVPPVVPPPGVLNRLDDRGVQRALVPQGPEAPHGGTCTRSPRSSIRSTRSRNWNRLYGRRGFVQYQFVVPFGEEAALQPIVERCAAIRAASFVTVLKRFGAGNPAPAVVPDARAGRWPSTCRPRSPGSPGWRSELDAAVLAAGGRHYLAKDALTSPEAFRRGYPRLDEWQAVRDKADPTGVWRSDQARRLGLV